MADKAVEQVRESVEAIYRALARQAPEGRLRELG
jgi:hypothetical protein